MGISFFVSGIVLGFSGGISPGPLLTLVVTETLQHGTRAGIRIAVAPVITDGPIILVILLALKSFSERPLLMGTLTLCGSGFLLLLAWKNFTFKGDNTSPEKFPLPPLAKGVMVNLFNPSPYLFWTTVGGPLLLKAQESNIFDAAAFLTGFYALLLGTKILIAVAIEKSRGFLRSKNYVYTIRILGGVLAVYALKFFQEGMQLILQNA